MISIKKLNAISSVVENILGSDYLLSDNEANPEGILVRSAQCHNMPFNSALKAIARAGAGTNNIPIDYCTKNGIVVFNTPGANANAVKELVFAAIMMSSRNLLEAVEWCKTLKGKGKEIPDIVEKGKSMFVGQEVKGKTLGVIGLGAIGVMVANEGQDIGLKVYGYDPFISVEHAWGLNRSVRRATSLEDLVANCDYISIHVPLNKDTHGYFNARLCSMVKQGATLLNFSRGEIVDSDAVLAGLEVGMLKNYIVDFPTDEMLSAKGVVCIPHLGASTPESEENCAEMAAKQLKDFLENGNIKNSVNMPDCYMARSGGMRICIINENKPNMIGQLTAALALKHANIANMINKSRGNVAYTIFDLDEHVNDGLVEKLKSIDGVIRVTVL